MGCGSSKTTAAANSTSQSKLATVKPPEIVTESESESDVEDEEGKLGEDFQPFAEFPTPVLLREANRRYTDLRRPIRKTADGRLQPYPTPTVKQRVFSTVNCEDLDMHAINAPDSLRKSPFEKLVTHLTKKAKTDVLKARVLFRWVTAQDLDRMDSGSTGEDEETPHGHLKRIKTKNGDYSSLYAKMCSLAGLQCQVLSGYIKGVHYEPGDEPDEDEHYGTWVAVLVDKIWRFVDVHWGSRHVEGGGHGDWELIDDNGEGAKPLDSGPESTKYKYNESYFLMNPEEFIYSHMPTGDEKWQLLARPVSLREFQEMAFLKPNFCELGLTLQSHRQCILQAVNGEIEIDIGLPPSGKRMFMYRLWIDTKGKDKSGSYGEYKLERFLFMQQKPGLVNFRIEFPVAGRFKVELFAKDADASDGGGLFSLACVYVINCDEAKEDCKPKPANDRKEWGPGADLAKAGLRPKTHHEGVIEAEDGTVEIIFATEKNVNVLCNLHSNTRTKDELKNYVTHRVEGGEVIVNVKLPETGDYALNMFAKEDGKEGLFPNVCSYMVSCEHPAYDQTPYPEFANGQTGVTSENKDVKLAAVSHKSSYILAPDSGELAIVMGTPKPVDLLAQLRYRGKNGMDVKDEYVQITKDKTSATFNVNLPKAGMYALEIFAKQEGKEGTYPNVYNYLIEAPMPKQNCLPFPKSFAGWGVGCKVLEPQSGVLPSNEEVHFAAQIPGAEDVAVIADGKWTHLDKEKDGLWHGDVKTGKGGESFKLHAKMDDASETYNGMLEYHVEGEDKLKKTEAEQAVLIEKAKKEAEEQARLEKKRQAEFAQAKKALLQAMDDRNIQALKKAIRMVEKKRYTTKLKEEMEQARHLMVSLERIEKLRHTILNMDASTMSEIRRYTKPVPLIHDVMIASLLLLGDNEDITRNWKECQKLCNSIGPTGLNRRVTDFDVTKLHPEIAARAKQLLQRCRLDDVREKSAGAGTFYVWAIGMIEELYRMKKEASKVQPANVKRQKEIARKG